MHVQVNMAIFMVVADWNLLHLHAVRWLINANAEEGNLEWAKTRSIWENQRLSPFNIHRNLIRILKDDTHINIAW